MDFIVHTISDSIDKIINHHRSLEKNMDKLKRKYEELNSRKEDVELKMKAELRPEKRLKKEVELWLANVQRINDKKQNIENEVREGKYFKRASLGEFVVEMIQEVEELHQKGSFSGSLVLDAPPRKGEIFPPTKVAGKTTAKKRMKEIWDFLMNDDTRLIGVYGMGGVGKTTIMQQIYNRLLEPTMKFNNVIWVTLSKVHDVINLQDCIAKAFNVSLSGREDETTRATKLFADLSEKKRYVLILDDVWEVFELTNVGIPKPTSTNGCKIVLTTRSLDVCRIMKCKEIKMELLSEDEAWNLFVDIVGRDVLPIPNLEATMKLVAEECARLPLAIITIAGSMKGVVDECEWRNTLEELREALGGIDGMEKVLKQLKHSYFRLKDEKLRTCLLYCALYPEDFKIERKELINYLIDEGIIEGKRSRQAEFDKGHSILNKLENACLLESVTNGYNEKCVKMHDLIRDMALQIITRGCMVEAGVRLRDFPDEEQWIEDLERVSLMNNYIREICSGASPRCSRLSTLLLLRNRELKRIPDSFFVHMVGLRTLDISYTGIKILPNSISDLVNLTALLLRDCFGLKYVPSLAKLRALRRLDLGGSGIEEVPQGMEMLVNLRCLNLNAGCLKMLPTGILPPLSRLQCLIVNWKSETLKVKGEEVAGLKKLETFAGQFDDLHDFNIYVRSLQGRGPSKYLLKVGPGNPIIKFDEGEGYFCKHVVLRKCSISKGGEDPLVLPNDIEFLRIEECQDVSSLSDVSSLNNATNLLKSCYISKCDGMKCVSSSSSTPLQSLEVLKLYELPNLHILFKGHGASPPPLGTFSCLNKLEIYYCPNIKKLFTLGWLPHLQNLEEIYVRECEGMEEIMVAKAEGKEEEQQGMGESSSHSIVNNDDTIITITLPKLRLLNLEYLPELKSIVCNRVVMVCDSLQEILVRECPKLKRLPLPLPMSPDTFFLLKEVNIVWCPNIKKLFMPGLLPHLQNLEEISIRNCEGMEEIIAAKVEGEEEEQQQRMGETNNHSIVNNDDTVITITLPKLRLLSLHYLPKLKSIISSRGIMVCDSLQVIEVKRCPKLKRLPLSLPMLNSQPSPPPTLKRIAVDGREWWETLEWDHPYAKDVLQHLAFDGRGQPV